MTSQASIAVRVSASVLLALGMAVTASAGDLKAGLLAADAAWAAAFAKGDAAAVAAIYTTDGQILAEGSEPVKGTAEIQKFIQGVMAEGVSSVVLTTLDVFGHGNAATEVGRYVMKDKAGKELDHGKYIEYWRLEKGAWKLHRDMFNSSVAKK